MLFMYLNDIFTTQSLNLSLIRHGIFNTLSLLDDKLVNSLLEYPGNENCQAFQIRKKNLDAVFGWIRHWKSYLDFSYTLLVEK